LKSCTGNGTFELGVGTASTMEKRKDTRALQQRIQRKRDISSIAGSVSYSK
jgi:hypothetical protein